MINWSAFARTNMILILTLVSRHIAALGTADKTNRILFGSLRRPRLTSELFAAVGVMNCGLFSVHVT